MRLNDRQMRSFNPDDIAIQLRQHNQAEKKKSGRGIDMHMNPSPCHRISAGITPVGSCAFAISLMASGQGPLGWQRQTIPSSGSSHTSHPSRQPAVHLASAADCPNPTAAPRSGWSAFLARLRPRSRQVVVSAQVSAMLLCWDSSQQSAVSDEDHPVPRSQDH
jgi:hypothetical protein